MPECFCFLILIEFLVENKFLIKAKTKENRKAHYKFIFSLKAH